MPKLIELDPRGAERRVEGAVGRELDDQVLLVPGRSWGMTSPGRRSTRGLDRDVGGAESTV